MIDKTIDRPARRMKRTYCLLVEIVSHVAMGVMGWTIIEVPSMWLTTIRCNCSGEQVCVQCTHCATFSIGRQWQSSGTDMVGTSAVESTSSHRLLTKVATARANACLPTQLGRQHGVYQHSLTTRSTDTMSDYIVSFKNLTDVSLSGQHGFLASTRRNVQISCGMPCSYAG